MGVQQRKEEERREEKLWSVCTINEKKLIKSNLKKKKFG